MASGGATTAPKANATGKLTGKISHVIRPTPKAVTTTSSTDNCAMERRFARKSITEVRMAAAYSSGGRKPSNTISDDSSETCISGEEGDPDSDQHQQQRRGEPDPISQRRYSKDRGKQAKMVRPIPQRHGSTQTRSAAPTVCKDSDL